MISRPDEPHAGGIHTFRLQCTFPWKIDLNQEHVTLGNRLEFTRFCCSAVFPRKSLSWTWRVPGSLGLGH